MPYTQAIENTNDCVRKTIEKIDKFNLVKVPSIDFIPYIFEDTKTIYVGQWKKG